MDGHVIIYQEVGRCRLLKACPKHLKYMTCSNRYSLYVNVLVVSQSACCNKVEVKRFFSFTYAFPALDHEWTGIMAILNWLKLQLGNYQIDDDTVKEFEAQIASAQQAELGAHGLPDNEPAQESKKATLADLRNKNNQHPGLGRHYHEGSHGPNSRPHDPSFSGDWP